jgi:DNA-directed RNA polymerase subunit K
LGSRTLWGGPDPANPIQAYFGKDLERCLAAIPATFAGASKMPCAGERSTLPGGAFLGRRGVAGKPGPGQTVNSVPRVGRSLTAAAGLVASGKLSVNDRSSPQLPGPGEYTRFERARILGARALQISLGAPILIDVAVTLVDPVEIAELEFAANRIPITVRRGTID